MRFFNKMNTEDKYCKCKILHFCSLHNTLCISGFAVLVRPLSCEKNENEENKMTGNVQFLTGSVYAVHDSKFSARVVNFVRVITKIARTNLSARSVCLLH